MCLKITKFFARALGARNIYSFFQGIRADGPKQVPVVLNGGPTRKCLGPPHAPVVEKSWLRHWYQLIQSSQWRRAHYIFMIVLFRPIGIIVNTCMSGLWS